MPGKRFLSSLRHPAMAAFPALLLTLILPCLQTVFPSPEKLPTPSVRTSSLWMTNATRGG